MSWKVTQMGYTYVEILLLALRVVHGVGGSQTPLSVAFGLIYPTVHAHIIFYVCSNMIGLGSTGLDQFLEKHKNVKIDI